MAKKLLLTSLLITIIGILTLLFTEPDITPQKLLLTGKITSINDRGKVQFIKFLPENLEVVSFKNLNLEENKSLSLVGTLQQYKGKVEFVVDGVR